MLNNFYFNPDILNLWEVYDAIKHFYPIGVHKSENGIYYAYPGIKELENLLGQNYFDSDNFQRRWGCFTTEILNETGKEIVGTTYGKTPSFSSSLIISKNTFGDCTHQKKINFSVSLLGNFYQIYGVDETTIYNDEERKYFISINVVTLSPFDEFKDSFNFVEGKLRARFPKHKIIPYGFGQMCIKGLQVRYLDDEDCSINQALFNHFLSGKSRYPTRGNEGYGVDQWKISDSKGGGWRWG